MMIVLPDLKEARERLTEFAARDRVYDGLSNDVRALLLALDRLSAQEWSEEDKEKVAVRVSELVMDRIHSHFEWEDGEPDDKSWEELSVGVCNDAVEALSTLPRLSAQAEGGGDEYEDAPCGLCDSAGRCTFACEHAESIPPPSLPVGGSERESNSSSRDLGITAGSALEKP